MDNLPIIVFVALQAIALAIALAYAGSRGRTLEEIDESLREAEGAVPSGDESAGRARRSSEDLIDGLRRLRRRAEAAEFGMEQRLHDLAYLADLVGVGIVRLSDDLRVEIANTAAHVFLRREPGTMLERTAIEALGDHRVETIAQGRARRAGRAGRSRWPIGMAGARAARSWSVRGARRSSACGWSSRMSPSCAGFSASGPSSSTTCPTSCARRSRRSGGSSSRSHGGVIRVESDEGRGAAFEFTIPVSDAPADRRPAERVPAAARAAGG